MADVSLPSLIPHVRQPRPHRRAAWQQGRVTGDLTPGQQGQMSSLDAMDMTDAYSPDIGSATPPTRPMSGDGENSGETPFMFASQNAGGQQVRVINGVEHMRVCDNGTCPWVPVERAAQPITQAAAQPKAAAVAASAPQATVQGAAPRQSGSPSFSPPMPINSPTAAAMALFGPAIDAARNMQTATSPLDKASLRFQADMHYQVGTAALEQFRWEQGMKQAERLENKADDIAAQRDPVTQFNKQQEIIASIRAGDGTIGKRARDVVTHRLSILSRQSDGSLAFSGDDVTKMIEDEEKVIAARDMAVTLDLAKAVSRQIGTGKPTYAQQVQMWKAESGMRQQLKDRYAGITDPNQLRLAVTAELLPAYRSSTQKDLEARGVTGDDLFVQTETHAKFAIDSAISAVFAMQRGEDAVRPMPMPPQADDQPQGKTASPQEAPAQKQPWWVISPEAWGR